MRIIQLEADHFKRLRAVSITPSGNVVEVTGANGEGKTSTLDAIWAALGGKDAAPAKPIHTGADKAEIRLVLGEGGEPKIKVTRTFKLRDGVPYTTDLKVESAEGARFPSPQGVLDALVGELCFDPLAFTRMPDKDQIATLRAFVPDVDFEQIEGLNRADAEERRDINRRAKEVRAQAEALPRIAGDMPDLIDVAALEKRLADVGQRNSELAQRQARRTAAEERVSAIQAQIMALTEEMHGLQQQLAKAEALPTPEDPEAIRQELADARQANDLTLRAQRREALEAEAAALEASSVILTARMQKRTEDAAAAVRAAKMPVGGLGFGEGVVTLDGEPFAQASQAQKIRASLAIAAAMNPKLRVARIADGSLLDRKSWALLEAFCREHDLQCWVETVSPHTAAAVLIEDGGIVAPASVQDEDVL